MFYFRNSIERTHRQLNKRCACEPKKFKSYRAWLFIELNNNDTIRLLCKQFAYLPFLCCSKSVKHVISIELTHVRSEWQKSIFIEIIWKVLTFYLCFVFSHIGKCAEIRLIVNWRKRARYVIIVADHIFSLKLEVI